MTDVRITTESDAGPDAKRSRDNEQQEEPASKQPTVRVKWQGSVFDIPTAELSVLGLKQALSEKTGVLPARCKLLGWKPPFPSDDVLLSSLVLPPAGLMLLGTPEAIHEALAADALLAPDVVDDLGDEDTAAPLALVSQPLVQQKIERRVRAAKHVLLNPPPEGKKLLVLDIDYTLFDHRSVAEVPAELMRPHLHEFLSAAYAHYDIGAC